MKSYFMHNKIILVVMAMFLLLPIRLISLTDSTNSTSGISLDSTITDKPSREVFTPSQPKESLIQNILVSFGVGMICNVIIFVVGLKWMTIYPYLKKRSIREFWGKSVYSTSFVIAYGALMDKRLQNNPLSDPYRYVKKYPNNEELQLVGPWEDIVSTCEIRAASYVINAISPFRREPVSVSSDRSVFGDVKRTIVAFGSPSSNGLTKMIMEEPSNKFYEFCQTAKGIPYILDKRDNLKYEGFHKPRVRDIGMILKLKNRYSEGNFFIVCAGLGEWGTSGAAWFLSNKWGELTLKGEEFGILIEVNCESDTTSFPLDSTSGVEELDQIENRTVESFENQSQGDEIPNRSPNNIDVKKISDSNLSHLSLKPFSTGSVSHEAPLASGMNNDSLKPRPFYDSTNASEQLIIQKIDVMRNIPPNGKQTKEQKEATKKQPNQQPTKKPKKPSMRGAQTKADAKAKDKGERK